MDLERVFQKLDGRHNPEWGPGPQKQPLEPVKSTIRATDDPLDGWKLGVLWLGMAICGLAMSIAVGYGIKAVIEALI